MWFCLVKEMIRVKEMIEWKIWLTLLRIYGGIHFDNLSVNTSDISLISKVSKPKHAVTHLRSISLCCYKFLTKTKVNMLDLLMSEVVSTCQTRFISIGINDKVLIMQAILHSIHIKYCVKMVYLQLKVTLCFYIWTILVKCIVLYILPQNFNKSRLSSCRWDSTNTVYIQSKSNPKYNVNINSRILIWQSKSIIAAWIHEKSKSVIYCINSISL